MPRDPQGKPVQRAGEPGMMVPAGVPMMLFGIGNTVRRSLVLILQDASQPRSTPATDWVPTGLCQPEAARHRYCAGCVPQRL